MAKSLRQLEPFDIGSVSITGGFWRARQEVNRMTGLPYQYKMCKDTGRIDSLKLKWRPGMVNRPHQFWDSDIFKWIEAAAYTLATHPDDKLAKRVDELVDMLAEGQHDDGYLNTYFTVVDPAGRWRNLRDMHELYCAGHAMEAAVAYYRATGKRRMLDVVCRYADHIDRTFGRGRGKKRGYPGHEEIELALVKLYRATGRKKYLRLSKYFIDERGRRPHYFEVEAKARGDRLDANWASTYAYNQAHLPVCRQSDAVGHAVRAGYLYAGMADVAGETGSAELFAACKRLWNSLTARRMYVTGGVGAYHHGEAIGGDYDLPNESAYAETCAAIALVFFAHRMLQIDPDRKYADVMERCLYNGTISGVSLDGRRFLYVNPLASSGDDPRHEWFGCACCPPNIARLIASLGGYVYSTADRAVYVHLYVAGSGTTELAGGRITLTQQTDYPWDGDVEITVGAEGQAEFAMMLRIPAWCRKHDLKVNGKAFRAPVVRGYARIRRRWADGDTVRLSLTMPPERIVAAPAVDADAGKVALQRGPVVYCLEACDHGIDVRGIILPDRAKLAVRFDKKLLGGCTVIEGPARSIAQAGWKDKLYRPADEVKTRPVRIRAVPYCLWGNRKPGPMRVWLPRA